MLHLKAIDYSMYTPSQEPGSVFAEVSTYPTWAQHKCQHDIHTWQKVTDG